MTIAVALDNARKEQSELFDQLVDLDDLLAHGVPEESKNPKPIEYTVLTD